MNNLVIVAVSAFNGKEAKPDVNGLESVYLTPIAGKCPNRNVLAGTVAKSAGFEEGKTYLAKWTRLEDDPVYGAQVGWTKIQEVTDPLAVITATTQLGEGETFDVDKSAKKQEESEPVAEGASSTSKTNNKAQAN